MLKFAQALLFATTILTAVSFAGYALAIISAKTARAKVLVGVGVGASQSTPASKGAPAKSTPVRGVAWWANKLTMVAFLVLCISMALRWVATGKPPMASHYEFAIMFCWGMLLFHLLFEAKYKVHTVAVFILPVVIGMLAYATTLSYEANPLMPALQNSPMLTLHVFTAALSYGAAVVSFGAAIMHLLADKMRSRPWPRSEVTDDLGYRSVVVAFPLLTISIILGALWANVAWGHYWSWDPKETAALVTWFIYGAYLHARVVRDWRGKKAAWLLVLGFTAIIFTYFGNLWFGGLHSYV
uniref:c-type cytochrome biogenesis protein CcsB n=1 Tax=Vaginimicrobium propionicum TaxID=1871034 RepID=UPI00097105A4|nr:c-type cytochrome biogenesis protein CcsB [Vaginimicrobium propionicum]